MKEMAYIGRKWCGCVVCMIVDRPQYLKDTAKEVSSWIKWGLTVERVTPEEASAQFNWNCEHGNEEPTESEQLSLF
ncbi:MAG: hypothetical protein LCI00_16750 [Chloroflexi bacterium]|nr:hypothetical protein [Chloroflexota bacterium]